MRRDPDILQDVALAARKAMRFVAGLTREQFLENEEKQSAVFGQLVILGEAANRVSEQGRAAHPLIPWRQVIATRNRVIHGYDTIDWSLVWDIVSIDLPVLMRELGKYLPIA